MTNFNYDNYDDDTKAKYDDGIEFLDDDFSFDDENYWWNIIKRVICLRHALARLRQITLFIIFK